MRLVATFVDAAPADQAGVGTLTPLLVGFGTSTSGGVDYRFLLCEGPPGSTSQCWQSAQQSSNSWTPPSNALAWDRQYWWQLTLIDRVTTQPTLGPVRTFTTAVREPTITSNLASRGVNGQEFHQMMGNYTTTATDATVSVAGPPLSVVRSYNSMDPRSDGMFGAGWSSRWDMKVVSENSGSSLLVTFPDGRQLRFAASGGGNYEPPPGMNATIASVAGGGWRLMDTTSTSYFFDSTGKLTKITDNRGRSQDLTYGGGKLATATGLGGRKLSFTWNGNHVATVSTDPVDGTALTWSYTYTGDSLATVCAPVATPNCTNYTYGSGSQYRTRVLDSDPLGYWRLGESSGTSAGDLGYGGAVATYSGITLGQPGALGGSTDTAVTNSTGHIRLPQNTIARMSTRLSFEAWFKTTMSGTIFSAASTATSNVPRQPVIYVGTDGKVRAQFLERPETGGPSPIIPITSSASVNNGAWHHVVLTVNGTSETLYLDGQAVGSGPGSQFDQWPANAAAGNAVMGSWAGFWPSAPTSATATFPFKGQMDEVAVFDRPLTAAEVQRHFAGGTAMPNKLTKITLPSGRVWAENVYDAGTDRLKTHTDQHGGAWQIGVPSYDKTTGLSTVIVTDPHTGTLKYVHDAWRGYRLVSITDQLTKTTSFAYDTGGFLTKSTDRNGNVVEWFNDARGNVIGHKLCRAAGNCQTQHRQYFLNTADKFDPRNDKVTVARDARSASSTDNTYATTWQYTSFGEPATLTTAATPDFPAGRSVTFAYTDGAEPASGGGLTPAGLLKTSKDARDNEAAYTYTSAGDLATSTSPSGLVTRFAYDPLGRTVSRTLVSQAHPAGVTATYAYDGWSRVVKETGPAILNELSGVTHTVEARAAFDADGNRASYSLVDLTGGDATSTTAYTYDTYGRVETITGPEGGVARYAYDHTGAVVSATDPNGTQIVYGYTTRGEVATSTLKNWTGSPVSPTPPADVVLGSYAYDPEGRLASVTDAMGRKTSFTYYGDDLPNQKTATAVRLNGSTTPRDVVLEASLYDAAGNLTQFTTGGGKTRADYTYDPAGRLTWSSLDPAGLARKVTYGYDANDNITSATLTGAGTGRVESATYQYNAANQLIKETVENGSTDPVTTWTFDDRGLISEITAPRGNAAGADRLDHTLILRRDIAGRVVEMQDAPVQVERGGAAPIVQRPTVRYGYDTGGRRTHTQDPEGGLSVAVFDKSGRLTSSTAPSYTPAGGSPITPTTSYSYDVGGRATGVTDPRGSTSTITYDALDRVARVTDPPATTGAARGTWDYTYTLNNELLSVTDPTGARQQATYDDLGRQITSTVIERKPTLLTLTRNATYDDAGNLISEQRPAGDTTTATVNAAGETTELTDPLGDKTLFAYDLAGRQTKVTDPLGNATTLEYDLAGRPMVVKDLDGLGAVLRTRSLGYDLDGNPISRTDAEGHSITSTFDALGRLTQMVEPVSGSESITTSFGYDARGSRTRYTDGRGNDTITTYNALGLRESVIEAATAQHPALADRTWTTVYDAGMRAVSEIQPGNVRIDRTFDNLGRLTQETGTGAEASTVGHTFAYDLAGRTTQAGDLTFTLNDRGRLLKTTDAGVDQATFAYDNDGRLSQRIDAAGTAVFTWDGDDRLSTAKDPLTGVTLTYGYDKADRTTSIAYGPSGPVRTFGYDALNRLTGDTLKTGGGATLASITYGYDFEDRLTTKTSTGTTGAGTNTYGYDQAGRLTSWTAPGGATTTYEWDAAGNRTRAGTDTFTYDERNRMTSGAGTAYTHTARGTTASETTGAVTRTYTFDAFDRMISDGEVTYAYDGLDRTASRTKAGLTTRFVYGDTGNDVVATTDVAGTKLETYGRGAFGETLSAKTGTAAAQFVMADQHGDVIATFGAAATTLTSSAAYDPFGEVTHTNGPGIQLGFQGEWTDADTGKVNMHARWYQPAAGNFTSRDTWTLVPVPSAQGNRYTYANASPLNMIDPSGHSPLCVSARGAPVPLWPGVEDADGLGVGSDDGRYVKRPAGWFGGAL